MYIPLHLALAGRRLFAGAVALIASFAGGRVFAIGTPTLLTPAHNSVGYMQYPNFTWTPVATAVSYDIQVAADSAFQVVVASDTVEIPRYVPKTALFQANRFWRVRASDGTTTGAWSTYFIYKLTAPTNPFTVAATDTLDTIRARLASAIASPPAKLTFGAGTYHLTPNDDFILSIANAHDLIIDGSNATIVVQRPSAGFVNLTNCQHVTVRNFKVDYDPMPHSVGKVTAVTTTGSGSSAVAKVTLRPETNYPAFDAPHMLANWSWGVILDKNEPGRMKPNTSLVLNFRSENVVRNATDSTAFDVQLTSASTAAQFAVDDRVIIFARDNGHSLCAVDPASSDIAFDNIINYACPAAHYGLLDCSDVKVLNCKSEKKAATPWFAGNADGVHVRANLIGPWIENCWFTGTGDDGIALYNKGISIKEQISSTQVKVESTFMNLVSGDTVRLFDPRNGGFIGTSYTIASAPTQMVTNGTWRIDFTPALPTGTTLVTDYNDLAQNDQFFNLSRRNAGFMIRGNHFDGVRRYGSIIRSADGVVKGNVYSGTSNAAIALLNEAATWQNGLYSERVLITDNDISVCGFDTSSLFVGSIMVTLKKISGLAGVRAHDSLVIDHNTITDWNQRAIMLQNASNCAITDNIIVATRPDFLVPGGANYGIFADNTTSCIINGNDLTGDARLTTAAMRITVTNSTGTTPVNNPPDP